MPTVEQIINMVCDWCLSIALDNSHGYSQSNRWGTPDYDCSSLIISAFQNLGVPVKTNGATYTGNMLNAFLKSGFKVVRLSERKRGDVLLAHNNRTGKGHTALYLGDEKIVHAASSETGTKSGVPGDQTGREICTRSYYNYPWDYCLRYFGGKLDNNAKECNNLMNTVLKFGYKGLDVAGLQALLNNFGAKLVVDGDFGKLTDKAVRDYQNNNKLVVDGIVGVKTWTSIKNRLM